MIKNFKIWVYKENLCPFISMVLSYGYKYGYKQDLFLWFLFMVINFQKWI